MSAPHVVTHGTNVVGTYSTKAEAKRIGAVLRSQGAPIYIHSVEFFRRFIEVTK